jgi:hypothetical protein
VQSHEIEPGKTTRSSFEVKLHPFEPVDWKRPSPDSLIVLSDVHAKWVPFVSVLKQNKVIDNDLHWIFGRNELMIIGDVFDRGDDATTCLWLIYKLQAEAREAGGEVYFNTGNHEEDMTKNAMRATNQKYKNLASKYFGTPVDESEYGSRFFNTNTELGRWIGKSNAIQIIGTDLFVHGGLSQEFYERNYEIPEVNEIMGVDILKHSFAERDPFLFLYDHGNGGPLAYRGFAPGQDGPLSPETFNGLLNRYNVKRFIIGHNEHNEGDGPIAYPERGYRVINVNVSTQLALDAKRGRGILIEKNGRTSIIYDMNAGKENKPLPLPI